MDANLVTLIVQIAAEEAPAIIDAVKNKGGSVANVGPMLSADAATIAADRQTLQDELQPPTA